jgi:NAD(P)-dependent dehydrogenase (short-subunit alcohol dehydrogenase family)
MTMTQGIDGIRVNCVCPGMVYTPMVYNRGMTEETREGKDMNYGWTPRIFTRQREGGQIAWCWSVVGIGDHE